MILRLIAETELFTAALILPQVDQTQFGATSSLVAITSSWLGLRANLTTSERTCHDINFL